MQETNDNRNERKTRQIRCLQRRKDTDKALTVMGLSAESRISDIISLAYASLSLLGHLHNEQIDQFSSKVHLHKHLIYMLAYSLWHCCIFKSCAEIHTCCPQTVQFSPLTDWVIGRT